MFLSALLCKKVGKKTMGKKPPCYDLTSKKLHENVKMFSGGFWSTSKFEVSVNVIVITNVTNTLLMPNSIPIKNIDEEQKADISTLQQIARIMHFLRNIED